MRTSTSRSGSPQRSWGRTKAIIIAASVGIAFDGSMCADSSADETAEPLPRKLIMVVRVGGESESISKDRLTAIMQEGLRKGHCQCEGAPHVNLISPTFYREFSRIVELADPKPRKDSGIDVTPVFAENNEEFPLIYDLALPKSDQILASIELTYDSGEKEEISLRDQGRIAKVGYDAENKPLYRIHVKSRPESYVVKVASGQDAIKTIDGAWPKEDTHFSVTLIDFQGAWEELRATLTNEHPTNKKMSDPLQEIQNVSDTRFVMAAIGRVFGSSGGGGVDGLLVVRQSKTENRDVTSILVKLPLSIDELREELKGFHKEDGKPKLGAETIKQIQGEGNQQALPFGLRDISEYPLLQASTPAKWYTLTADSNGSDYAGGFSLGDAENQRELVENFPKMFMLVVQQSGEGEDALAVPVAWDASTVDPSLAKTREAWVVPKRVRDADLTAPVATE